MMADQLQPKSTAELASRNAVRFPNERKEYSSARTALLAEEIELRRDIERVAQQRRALQPGEAVASPTCWSVNTALSGKK